MKKALVILMALAMVFAAFAGEKAADIGGADKDGKITLSAKFHC